MIITHLMDGLSDVIQDKQDNRDRAVLSAIGKVRQFWIRVIAVIFILASFTACKKEIKGEPQAESSVSVQDSNVELSDNNNSAVNQQPMQIVCNGNDEAVLQITNDEARKLLGSTDTDSKKYLMIAFFLAMSKSLDFIWMAMAGTYQIRGMKPVL